MKLIFQIAIGVFLGTLTSQLLIDNWHTHQQTIAKQAEEKQLAEQEKVRLEQGNRVRTLILQSRQGNTQQSNKPPAGFVHDDAQPEIPN